MCQKYATEIDVSDPSGLDLRISNVLCIHDIKNNHRRFTESYILSKFSAIVLYIIIALFYLSIL